MCWTRRVGRRSLFPWVVGGLTVLRVVGPKATELIFSLETRDPAEAKTRKAEAVSYFDRTWNALRSGSTTLTERETAALAGELYRGQFKAAGDDPGPNELWRWINSENEAALAGEYRHGFIIITETAKRQMALENRLGHVVCVVLARHSLSIEEGTKVCRLISGFQNGCGCEDHGSVAGVGLVGAP